VTARAAAAELPGKERNIISTTANAHGATALICSLALCISACSAGSSKQLIQDAQNSVSSAQPYRFNTDIRITLKLGQAIQLDCESNPYGLEKFIVYYYADVNAAEDAVHDVFVAPATGKTPTAGNETLRRRP